MKSLLILFAVLTLAASQYYGGYPGYGYGGWGRGYGGWGRGYGGYGGYPGYGYRPFYRNITYELQYYQIEPDLEQSPLFTIRDTFAIGGGYYGGGPYGGYGGYGARKSIFST
ncbi:hypothetical protein TELCIR_08180 [Teladorsagia circumcincta]|uniref:Neuropeptide-like protein 31 family protein n=1 Tax=Teladorsagia circumcincta TaxID=45464 RepID=A0A2G9UI95_TELCI|nr:hypothetical protein TELCIR_08180 [Teladorsagia circumcincta]